MSGKSSIDTGDKGLRFGSVLCRAAGPPTQGVVPPDELKPAIEQMGIAPGILELVGKMDGFAKGTLKTIPVKTDSNYQAAVEYNSQLIFDYAKAQYSRCKEVTPAALDLMFDHNKLAGKNPKTGGIYEAALVNARKIFSRRDSANYWDAVFINVQGAREEDQQLPAGVVCKSETFKDAKLNLVYINRGFGFSSLTTQSKKYILETTREQKDADSKAFNKWYELKCKPLTRILRLSVADIPLDFDPSAIINFEIDPSNAEFVVEINESLVLFQNLLIIAAETASENKSVFVLMDEIKKLAK